MWSRLTGSGQAQQTQGSGEAQQTQESCARSTDRQHVISTEVPAAGVGLNDRTLEIPNTPEHIPGKRNGKELQRLIKAGDVAAAHDLMDKLKDNGTANVVHFNIMLQACEDSTEMRHVIGTEMLAARVEPDVVTFTTLVSRLVVEGDVAGARRVVEEEMPAAGVQPDDRTLEILRKPEVILGKRNGKELQRLIKAGDVAAAHVLMDKLKDNDVPPVP
jgi:pentatricopeptide repeat protein